ncbi:chorismate-binding protein [Sphingomonas glaciei]|uniref:anthranilate synthase n=1 Tax=Sphingomonas glaciei TaxID=2938948 RepID=A0ABY5MTN5_9SPHN|nr:chorismate-binding protein [Sphingomonas glaciei]UUR07865.1 chorismate-binding protein [Sphingomonas glaciei]
MKVEAQVLARRLPAGLDPLAAYRALGGGEAGTGLFEAPDGQRLIMGRACVRAEAREGHVVLDALNANGEALLAAYQAPWVSERRVDRLVLTFARPTSEDAAERLLGAQPLHALRALLDAAAAPRGEPFGSLLLGVAGFDLAAWGEDMPAAPPAEVPDFVFFVPDTLLTIAPGGAARLLCTAFGPDERHVNDAARRLEEGLAALASPPVEQRPAPTIALPAGAAAAFPPDLSDPDFIALVARLKQEIAAGEVYQIVPSRTFTGPCPDPLAAYARLRQAEPASYRFFLVDDGWTLLGASPETSVRLSPGGPSGRTVEVKPIAGTRPRGASPDADDRMEAEMRLDGKELAEHMMLVDLARNDIARVSLPGTRRVAKLLTVERFARVMHLVSSVTGTLRPGLDAFDALAACLNVGTLVGAPKIRAMQLLRAAEVRRRGPYGGAIGWIGGDGRMDTAVVIRSALVRDGVAEVRSGAGVVHDSVPQAEADETRAKASALLGVLGA